MVFVPKYRRKVFYGQKLHETGKILGELSGWKYAGGDTAEDECVEFYRFSESEKRLDALQALEQHKIQVSQQRVSEQGIPSAGKNARKIAEYTKSAEGRRSSDRLTQDPSAPFTKQVTKCTCRSVVRRKRNRQLHPSCEEPTLGGRRFF